MRRDDEHRDNVVTRAALTEDTLADQINHVFGSLLYCADERLDQILGGLPGMAQAVAGGLGDLMDFDLQPPASDDGDAGIGFTIAMARAVLLVHVVDDAGTGPASPEAMTRLRRAARAAGGERPQVVVLIGGGEACAVSPATAEMAPVCRVRWSDLAEAVQRLANPSGRERRLLAQLAALPNTGAPLPPAAALKPLTPQNLAWTRLPRLAAAVLGVRTGSDEPNRRLWPLIGSGITTIHLGSLR